MPTVYISLKIWPLGIAKYIVPDPNDFKKVSLVAELGVKTKEITRFKT